jgi:dihydrofolate reductase
MIAIVVVIDEKNGIGKNGGLLCHLPNDLKHFKKITTGHTIIMGRKTYESLPNGSLPDRINIVVTSGDVNNFPGCIVVRSIEEALSVSKSH